MLYECVFRTHEYYLYDPFSQEFLGYHLHGTRYQEMQQDAEQQIYFVVTGLYVGVREGWLRWLTTDGVVVPTPREWAEQELLQPPPSKNPPARPSRNASAPSRNASAPSRL